ncbi:protein-histidine kinase [Gigaspora margarita]|nr:protein-histidine kinase [Gigaspora margarita]
MCIFIDPSNWTLLYNKAFVPILMAKHPALGKQVKDVWPKIYEIRISIDVVTTGESFYSHDQHYILQCDGYYESVYFNYTYNPIFKSDGKICALWCITQETTQQVLNTRKLK